MVLNNGRLTDITQDVCGVRLRIFNDFLSCSSVKLGSLSLPSASAARELLSVEHANSKMSGLIPR